MQTLKLLNIKEFTVTVQFAYADRRDNAELNAITALLKQLGIPYHYKIMLLQRGIKINGPGVALKTAAECKEMLPHIAKGWKEELSSLSREKGHLSIWLTQMNKDTEPEVYNLLLQRLQELTEPERQVHEQMAQADQADTQTRRT